MAQGTGSSDMIISKARVKAAVNQCNVGSDFYDALEAQVRALIAAAEKRALANSRKTLKAQDA